VAVTEVSICNLALQKLGADPISSLLQVHPNASVMNAVYETLRDLELRQHRWNFAKSRATLAPDATAPSTESGFSYAFPLPTDYLRLLSPNESNNISRDGGRNDVDWKIERHQGRRCILTNDGATLDIAYVARVEDPAQFDACFVEALACRLAWQTCERVTQSNSKKTDAAAEYKEAIREAKRLNAVENVPIESPTDTWLTVQR